MIEPWKRIKDEVIFEDKYNKLDLVTFELPHGGLHDFHLHGTSQHVASVMAITEDGQFILAREFRPGPDQIIDEIPGGLIDKGESPEDAAKRELLEETGYEGDIRLLGRTFISAYSPKLKYCFLATNCKKVGEVMQHDRELIEAVLKSKDEFVVQIEAGECTDLETALWGLRVLEREGIVLQ